MKRSFLYLFAILLAAAWALGVFYWDAGRMVHLLLVLAIISLLFGLIHKTPT